MNVLVTTTSFMDTPGKHHDLLEILKSDKYNAKIDVRRGPLSESELLPIIQDYDAILCGDDEYTETVLRKGYAGKLRILSKYGIGLDKINQNIVKELGISLTNTPGVNHTTVAEHTLTHILSFYRNYYEEVGFVKKGQWKRMTGHEIMGKRLAIYGLGRIGKEVAVRAKAFGMDVMVYDPFIDMEFVKNQELKFTDNLEELFNKADIITLHSPLTETSCKVLNERVFAKLQNQPLVVNTARAGLIDKQSLIYALDNKLIAGYVTDVMWDEPIKPDEPLLAYNNVFITPHIGSRTFESVQRQGLAAANNLIKLINEYFNHE